MGWLFGQLNRQKPTKTDLVSLTRRVGWTSPGLFFPNRRVDETSPRLVSYISCPLGMGAANVAHRPMTEEWEKRRSEIALSTSTPVTYIYVISSLQKLFKVSSIIRYDWFSVISSMKDWFFDYSCLCASRCDIECLGNPIIHAQISWFWGGMIHTWRFEWFFHGVKHVYIRWFTKISF